MSRRFFSRFVLVVAVIVVISPLQPLTPAPSLAQSDCQLFPETGIRVCGRFLHYWQTHGGLAQQGLPISGWGPETSNVDGKVYTTQYFERAVFEAHPENQPPNDVLLSLLGALRYHQKYPSGAFGQQPSTAPNARYFPQTGHTIGGEFLTYWLEHGGITQQGYPITDEFPEVSTTDGRTYIVQYFERAVFEHHPENEPPWTVLLSQLGKFQFQIKYGTIQGQEIDFTDGNSGTFHGVVEMVRETKTVPPCSLEPGGTTAGKFILVFMTVTNTGLRGALPGTDNLKLRDGAGRTFDIVHDIDIVWAVTECSDSDDYLANLQPGVPTPIVFIFNAAPDSVNYYLVAVR